jgi:hypothetical protein
VLRSLSVRGFVALGAVLVTAVALLPVATAAVKPGTRANPHDRGARVRVDGFVIRVLSTDTNAWTSIRGSGNRAPARGRTDVLVTMHATNRAGLPGIPFVNGELGAVGRYGTTYSSLVGSCGTIARDVTAIDPVAPGKTVVVRTCWQVPRLDARSLVMSYAPYDGSRTIYFALR